MTLFSVGDQVFYGSEPADAVLEKFVGQEGEVLSVRGDEIYVKWIGFERPVYHYLSMSGRCIRKLDDEADYASDFE